MDFESKLHFLTRRDGAAAPHLGGVSLLVHLLGTHDILRRWGEVQPVCDAGLFHSAYGTSRYRHALLAPGERGALRRLIGERAEMLVHRYGEMDPLFLTEALVAAPGARRLRARATGEVQFIDEALFRDLCHVLLANWIEQHPRSPASRWSAQARAAARLRPFLRPAGRAALAEALAGASMTSPAADAR